MSLLAYWLRAKDGETVSFKPRGGSMKGLIESGELVKVAPCTPEDLRKGSIVLVKVRGNVYLHKVLAIQGNRYQIGNNRGGINGWTTFDGIAGRCVEVSGREI